MATDAHSSSTFVRLRRLRPALGSWIAIEAGATQEATAREGIEAAWEAVRVVENRMHPTRPGTDLRRLRDARAGEPVDLHPWTAEVLACARHLHALSDGVFDPCLPERPGALADLELQQLPGGRWQASSRAPVAVDLGGIAKGFAVDRALAALESCGCVSGLVNAGGDLRVFGTEAPVLLRRGEAFEPWLLRDAAIAVSERAGHASPGEHRGYYVRGGRPRGRSYAAVTAPDAMSADALTKCVLLCEPQRALEVLRHFGARAL